MTFGQLIKANDPDIKVARKSNIINKDVHYFLAQMNIHAQEIGMKNTYYDSPHGLGNPLNLSTAYDQCLMI